MQSGLSIVFLFSTTSHPLQALEMGFSVHRGPFWEPGGRLIYCLCSVNGTSLSVGALREPGGRAPLLGTLKAMKNLSRKAFDLSLCRGCVRGTWREGSYTEDSLRHLMEGSGNGAFLL